MFRERSRQAIKQVAGGKAAANQYQDCGATPPPVNRRTKVPCNQHQRIKCRAVGRVHPVPSRKPTRPCQSPKRRQDRNEMCGTQPPRGQAAPPCAIDWEISRAIVSVGPPATNGTIVVSVGKHPAVIASL